MAASKHFLTFTEQIESLKNEFVSLIQAGYPAHTVPHTPPEDSDTP